MNTEIRKLARSTQRGMTLIEILVVLAIIGLIVGGVAVAAFGRFSSAQEDAAKQEVIKTVGMVEMYQLQKKRCPQSMADLKKAGIITRVAKDPWGKDYKIICPGKHGSGADVISAGPDGEFETADDITNWQEEGDAQAEDDK